MTSANDFVVSDVIYCPRVTHPPCFLSPLPTRWRSTASNRPARTTTRCSRRGSILSPFKFGNHLTHKCDSCYLLCFPPDVGFLRRPARMPLALSVTPGGSSRFVTTIFSRGPNSFCVSAADLCTGHRAQTLAAHCHPAVPPLWTSCIHRSVLPCN